MPKTLKNHFIIIQLQKENAKIMPQNILSFKCEKVMYMKISCFTVENW